MLLITRISELVQEFVHTVKATGVEFTTRAVPVTVIPVIGKSPLALDVQYTLWLDPTTNREVLRVAQALIDGVATDPVTNEFQMSNVRLALVNGVDDFVLTAVKVANLKRKDGSEYSINKRGIYLADDVVADWSLGELPVNPLNGNIALLRAFVKVDRKGATLLETPVSSELAPF